MLHPTQGRPLCVHLCDQILAYQSTDQVLLCASSFYSDSTLVPRSPEVPNHGAPPLTPVAARAPDEDDDAESAAAAPGARVATIALDLSLCAITTGDLGHEIEMLRCETMCYGC
jgi:hypothetical protein